MSAYLYGQAEGSFLLQKKYRKLDSFWTEVDLLKKEENKSTRYEITTD